VKLILALSSTRKRSCNNGEHCSSRLWR
jgi:hypothetical protein